MMNRKTNLAIVAIMGMVGFAATNAMAAVTYTGTYEGDVIPYVASPAWQVYWDPTDFTTLSTDGTVLTMATTTGQRGSFIMNSTAGGPWQGYTYDGAWDGSTATGSTIDFRVFQVDGDSRFRVTTGTVGADLIFERVSPSTMVIAADTSWSAFVRDPVKNVSVSPGFADVRIVIEAGNTGVMDVYVNDMSTVAFTLNTGSTGTNVMMMGDQSGGAFSGTVEYDYVRWTNAEAVPEPATLGLLGLGGLMMLPRRRSVMN